MPHHEFLGSDVLARPIAALRAMVHSGYRATIHCASEAQALAIEAALRTHCQSVVAGHFMYSCLTYLAGTDDLGIGWSAELDWPLPQLESVPHERNHGQGGAL